VQNDAHDSFITVKNHILQMKNSFLLLSPLIAALFLSSCSSTKKVALDPISVHGARQGSHIYQASYTRLTDIIHTSLDLKLNWDSAYVIGRATIEAKPYSYPLSEVVLDAKGFRISQISLIEGYDNKPLKYTYNNKRLRIELGQKYTESQKFKIQIDYVAMPEKLKIYDIFMIFVKVLCGSHVHPFKEGRCRRVFHGSSGEVTQYNLSIFFPGVL